jgi:hypothetical protein
MSYLGGPVIRRKLASPTAAATIAFASGLAALTIAALAATPAAARAPLGSGRVDPSVNTQPSIDPIDASASGTNQSAGSGVTPLVAPIPFKNTQVGWGIALMLGLIHRFDPDTAYKPSTGGIAGFYTENKSWGWMAMEMARIQHDTWRLRGLVSHCDINYDFFGIGEDAGAAGKSIPLEQKMDFAVASALRRVTPGFYGGASVLWLRTSVALRNNSTAVVPPSGDLPTTDLVAPGIVGEYDTRDDDYWPRRGSIASLKGNFFTSGLGSSRDFQRYAGAWCWYRQLPYPRTILAANAGLLAAAGDVPFWAIPSIGGGQYGLRGYTQGRYRDDIVTTAQAELRWHAPNRFGAVAFGGFGQVAPSVGELPDARVLWGGGAGVRFQLTKEYPMHMRLDFAWGRDEGLLYFSVGEAF